MPEAINDMKINSVNINVSIVLFIQKKRGAETPLFNIKY